MVISSIIQYKGDLIYMQTNNINGLINIEYKTIKQKYLFYTENQALSLFKELIKKEGF